jgi:DNA-binding response OmpR family regulator
MLPGTDGHSICRNLRENHVITPVLMISSLNSNKEIQAGFSAGANDYMVKPFHFDELYDKIIMLENKYKS